MDPITAAVDELILELRQLGELPGDAKLSEEDVQAAAAWLRDGWTKPRQIAGFTPAQLPTLVLIWLVLLAEPEVVLKLHPAVQEVANGEVGTIGLAVALTVIMASR